MSKLEIGIGGIARPKTQRIGDVEPGSIVLVDGIEPWLVLSGCNDPDILIRQDCLDRVLAVHLRTFKLDTWNPHTVVELSTSTASIIRSYQ